MRTRLALLSLALAAAVSGALWAQPRPPRPAPPATRPGPAATAPAVDTVVVSPKTEEILKGALRWLAAKQTPAGAWTSPNGEHPIAVTGYTLMAFLATGNLPNEGDYGKNVTAGAEYLLRAVRADGYITSEAAHTGRKNSNMYDHGIGAIALAEIYGQTQDPKVREKLVAAIKLIVNCQNQAGGWRYAPIPKDADISVTVLQVVALRAAKNAGLDVPQKTIDRGVEFVKSCFDERSGGFCYQPHSGPGFARTAAGIYSLQVCGLYDDPMVAKGAEYLTKSRGDRQYATYGHFYAAPAEYMIGGKTWEKWYAHICDLLLNAKDKLHVEGNVAYWEGLDPTGAQIGPVYATAVYVNMLAMPYHYVPLYQR